MITPQKNYLQSLRPPDQDSCPGQMPVWEWSSLFRWLHARVAAIVCGLSTRGGFVVLSFDLFGNDTGACCNCRVIVGRCVLRVMKSTFVIVVASVWLQGNSYNTLAFNAKIWAYSERFVRYSELEREQRWLWQWATPVPSPPAESTCEEHFLLQWVCSFSQLFMSTLLWKPQIRNVRTWQRPRRWHPSSTSFRLWGQSISLPKESQSVPGKSSRWYKLA